MPPTFILSQNQTLHFNVCLPPQLLGMDYKRRFEPDSVDAPIAGASHSTKPIKLNSKSLAEDQLPNCQRSNFAPKPFQRTIFVGLPVDLGGSLEFYQALVSRQPQFENLPNFLAASFSKHGALLLHSYFTGRMSSSP